MKHFTSLLFLLVFNILFLNAQDIILLEQDSVSLINTGVDISDVSENFALDLYFKNNTNESILVNWRREIGEDCPLGWDIFVADQFNTWIPEINESITPIPLTPNDSHFIVRQVFLPQTIAGCCDVKMIFSLEDEPNTPIDTGYYHIEINSGNCIITTVLEEEKERFDIYPNPTSNFLNIKNSQAIELIEIIDLSGKSYQYKVNTNLYQLDISSFHSGVYFCKIKNKSGEFVIKKIIKI